jgi:hypothetical protein
MERRVVVAVQHLLEEGLTEMLDALEWGSRSLPPRQPAQTEPTGFECILHEQLNERLRELWALSISPDACYVYLIK